MQLSPKLIMRSPLLREPLMITHERMAAKILTVSTFQDDTVILSPSSTAASSKDEAIYEHKRHE